MSIVKNIVTETHIGQTRDGFHVNAVVVGYVNGLTGTLYRLNRGDGKVYGLQSEKPALMACCQGAFGDYAGLSMFAPEMAE